MARYNYKIVIEVENLIDTLENIEFQAGTTLVRNIKANARKYFGHGKSGYPYEFKNSFQSDKVVYYSEPDKAVFVDHPAAKVLEYGIGKQKITPKNAEYLVFEGKDNELVAVKEVVISPKKPVGYAREAIEETMKDLRNLRKYKKSANIDYEGA